MIAYQEFSEKTEKLCEWFCIAMLGSCSFCSCLTLIFSFVNYYIFNMGEKSFYLMYSTVYVYNCILLEIKIWARHFTSTVFLLLFTSRLFPITWRAPFGFVVAWFYEMVVSYIICAAIVSVLSLIFASSWLFVIIADHNLTQELATFNGHIKTSAQSDHVKMVHGFCDIVRHYSDAKE